MVEIKRVVTDQDWDDFFGFPWTIYRGNPHWVPPLRSAVRELLDVNINPFFRHAFLFPILALKNGKTVGRIAGIIDESHNRFHQERVCFFGFFESQNDPEIARRLLNEVQTWAKSRGMVTLRGPVNPSTNHECGLLVNGFDDRPAVMMTYNPRYYAELLEGAGLVKAKDLYAYKLVHGTRFSERILAQAERMKEKSSVRFRPLKMANFEREIGTILDIYNTAWEKNWGFVPMNPDEFRYTARQMKPILDPRLALLAEVAGEPAAFSLALPDVHMALDSDWDGRMLPFGWARILWNIKGPGRRKIRRLRVVTLGIKAKYQALGLGPMFYTEYLKTGPALGYHTGEASWILEDNTPMNRALGLMGAERYKTYRIYERPIEKSGAIG